MDPMTLAASATAFLAPYISATGEKVVEKIAERLPEQLGKLWKAVLNRFEGNQTASGAANDLAKDANDEDAQATFSLQLKKAITADPEFATLVTDLLNRAKREASISNVGDGAVATNHSSAIGKIEVGGNLSGNIVVGDNAAVGTSTHPRKKK